MSEPVAMLRLEYRALPGLWITIQEGIPADRFAETWARWVWKTTTPIRLVDTETGLAIREYHPSR